MVVLFKSNIWKEEIVESDKTKNNKRGETAMSFAPFQISPSRRPLPIRLFVLESGFIRRPYKIQF